jgi:hypothetical protein
MSEVEIANIRISCLYAAIKVKSKVDPQNEPSLAGLSITALAEEFVIFVLCPE